MKAQQLRDKLATVREFIVLIDGKQIEEVAVDISNSTVHVLSFKAGRELPDFREMEKKEELKPVGTIAKPLIDGAKLLEGKG